MISISLLIKILVILALYGALVMVLERRLQPRSPGGEARQGETYAKTRGRRSGRVA